MRTREFHRPLIAATLTILLVVLLADPVLRGLFTSSDANAVGGYSASGALGQLDETDSPFYTSSGANNAPSAQGIGLDFGADDASVALDGVGHRLFVADANNNRVLVFNLDASNHLVDHTADAVLGQPNVKSNAASLTATGFAQLPAGLAYDAVNQRLFVADTSGNRIMVFDVASITNGEAAVNVLGQADFTSGNPGTTQSTLNLNVTFAGMAYDPTGERLFVADEGNGRVMVFDVATISDGENAANVLGKEDFVTAGNTGGQDGLSAPAGISFDDTNDRLFVGDNHRVMVFDVAAITDGEDAANVLGQTDFTGPNCNRGGTLDVNTLCNAYGSAYDPTGQLLFVGDNFNNRVMVFDVATIGNGEDAVNVLGQADFVTGTATTTQGGLSDASGVAVDSAGGTLFVFDAGNNRVMVFDVAVIADGEDAIDLIGQLDETDAPVYTVNGGNNAPNAQGFNLSDILRSADIAIDSVNHRLFAADVSNARVLVFNLDVDNQLVDHTADAVLCQATIKTNAAAVTQGGCTAPGGLAYDSANNRLFVSDASSHRVLIYDVATIANGENAINVLGQADFVSSGESTTQSSIGTPRGIAYDAGNERLYVVDRSSYRVMVFDVAVITDGENAVNVLGQADFVSGGSGPAQSGFDGPEGIAFDAANNRLFVADGNRSRVMVFDVATIGNGEDAVNVLGQPDFVSGGSVLSQSGFDSTRGVAYDASSSQLYVTDIGHNRIMVFDVATITDGEDAVDVYGQTDFISGGAATTQTGFDTPSGIAVLGEQLFVMDTSNDRVMIFGGTPAPTPTPTPAPGGGGSGGSTPPRGVGFVPERIVVNADEPSTNSRNVLVTVYAGFSDDFVGTIDVLLSNDPMFTTYVPFRYNIHDARIDRHGWPKTIGWDLCWGVPFVQCVLGTHTVHARFYVNVPLPKPALTPAP